MMQRIKSFLIKLNRLIDYIPVIWNSGDYDYGYSIDVFRYQLERTANYIQSNGHIKDSDLVALQIKTACELIDNSYRGGHVEQAEAEFERQYGTCDIEFHDYDGDNFELVMWWQNAEDEEHNNQINEYYRAHMAAAYEKSDRDKQRAWNYIHKNIEAWWD